ncbi:MAG TPA: Smr/MutS family protein, partial [Chitinophagales bacterium]|nr:Smr/MutS family protein [Chitinophagales bacterium]
IPAKETSSLCVFQHLFVDIGDEQSIENDLSTYSSHLSNMNFFLKNANEKTLILIDEMGMGTDPALGGPMAEAIVEQLHKEKVFGVITTHFNNLKIFAANTDNMLSGAMSFDTRQLKPLYQLQMGQPGSSFTFEIAKKSGLHEQIIKNATAKIGGNKKALDDVLTDIQTEKQFIKGLRKNVQAKESQLQDLTKSYEQLNIDLDKEKRKLLKQYEARLLDRFNAESRNLENEMRTWKEQKNNKEKFLDVRNFIDVHRENIEIKLSEERTNSKPVSNRIFKIGDTVKLEDSSQIGKVLDVKNGIATVTFGFIQSKMKLNKLILVQDNKPKIETKINSYTSKMIIEKSEFDQQLDLRGMLKEEAIIALDIFMDKAIMYGMHQIKIIHGRGTGALKQAVQSFLKSYPHVKNYKFEIEQFGGDGITLVELK